MVRKTSSEFWSGAKEPARGMEGGAGSEAGKSNKRPSGKIPEASEMRNSPAARASRLIWRVTKPQGLPVRDSKRNSRELSMKRSWACRCCGLRKVPFIQMTGWSRFIGYQVSRTARDWQRWLDSPHKRGYTQTRITRRVRMIGGSSSRSSKHVPRRKRGELVT